MCVDVDRFVCDFAWDSDFPKGYGYTSISYLKTRAGYEKAKNGDKKAADSVVRQCIKHSGLQYCICRRNFTPRVGSVLQ